MRNTPSHTSDHLCLIWEESIQNSRSYRVDTECGKDGRTDGQTEGRMDGVKPFHCVEGITKRQWNMSS